MEYDLTPKLAQYMDKHFVVHLLDHLQQVTSSPTNDNSQQADTNEEKNDGGSSEQDGDKNPDNVSLISQIPMKEDSNTNDQENGDGTKDDIVSFYSRLGVNEAMYQVLNGTFMYDEQVTTQANVKQLLDSIESLDPNSKSTSNSNLLLKKIATKEKIEQRKKNFLNKFSSYQEKCGVLLDAFSDNEEMINLFKDKKFTMTEFSERYGVTYKDLDNLYEYCRMRYEMGYYKNTDKLLNYFIELYEIDESKRHKAMFGKLAVEILEEKWQDAITDVEKIFSHIQKMSTIANRKLAAAIAAVGAANEAAANGRTPIGASSSRTAGKDDASGTSERKDGTNQSVENVENVENGDKKEDGANDGAGAGARAGARAGVVQTVEEAEAAAEAAKLALSRSAAVALREKAWLLHWSLFIYFNQNDGAYLDFLVDLFIDNMTTIETIAPHLLRYMAAAVLISDKNTDKLQKLVEISRYIDEVSKFFQFFFFFVFCVFCVQLCKDGFIVLLFF